jgi:hypothetical protein
MVTVAWPLPLFVIDAPLNTILDTPLTRVGSESSNVKDVPKDAVDICLILLPLSPTHTYPCLNDAVNGPAISKEPVICILFVVATTDPVALNIPSVVAVPPPPPNDDVATKVALLLIPPTQAYPLAKDAVNVAVVFIEPPDDDISNVFFKDAV